MRGRKQYEKKLIYIILLNTRCRDTPVCPAMSYLLPNESDSKLCVCGKGSAQDSPL